MRATAVDLYDGEAKTSIDKADLSAADINVESSEVVIIDAPRVNRRLEDLEVIQNKYTILRRLAELEEWLGGKGIDSAGLNRIPEDQRNPPSVFNMMFFWFTMNLQPTFLIIGAIGVGYGLSLNETMWIAFIGNLAGSAGPAWTATLCPPTGLRQIAVSRFALGIWGAKIASFANIIITTGFGVSSVILGGQLLTAASGNTMSPTVGITLMTTVAWIISFLGFYRIHTVLKYSWIISFIIVFVSYIQSPKYWAVDRDVRALEGREHVGGCLSFFALNFGAAMGWATMSGDYYVQYPANISKKLVFGLTYIGLIVPIVFSVPLGVLVGGSIVQNEYLAGIYGNGNAGGVIAAILTPAAWGRTAAAFFFISYLGYQSAAFYSMSLDVQLFSKYTFAVPRFIWSLMLAGIVLGLAIGGQDSLAGIISDFVSLLGYWVVSFISILFLEHTIFRPRLGGYDAENWRDQSKMPLGLAGIFTLLASYAIATMGMVQTWYVGILARQVSDNGGDLGDYLAFTTCLLFYPILRHLEIKKFGR